MTERWFFSDHIPPTEAGTYIVRVTRGSHRGRYYVPNVNKAEWRLYPYDPLGGRWFFDGKLGPYPYGLIEYLVEIT